MSEEKDFIFKLLRKLQKKKHFKEIANWLISVVNTSVIDGNLEKKKFCFLQFVIEFISETGPLSKSISNIYCS